MMHEFWEILVSGLAGSATIIIAYIAIKQARTANTTANQTKDIATSAVIQAESSKIQAETIQHEFKTAHRPWIAPLEQLGLEIDTVIARFDYKNYGSIPAVKLTERANVSKVIPQKDVILNDFSNLQDPSIQIHLQIRGQQ